jgi:hypothetical protein
MDYVCIQPIWFVWLFGFPCHSLHNFAAFLKLSFLDSYLVSPSLPPFLYHPPVVRPRPVTATSVPGLLALFQNEWDALMLETHTLKEHLAATRTVRKKGGREGGRGTRAGSMPQVDAEAYTQSFPS